ncbi:tetratricopeptide repeat protein [Caldisalinibacter kiritimatiensis]|uniref:TPR repeat protein n=1 Tax=Caldisalinibacter kiritimatiensis TaxID=1304284 RepID=R1CL26_9FIRM|nr:tetratricopeptide repeat protein [Caldisalinibacter kiritimatiensis]EOC99410.1 TPR repeat protein [Caldisalinibacter kiritimatiensis]
MIKSVEEFFKQKTDNLTFVNLKEEANVVINGYTIQSSIPMPIIMSDLVNEIKGFTAQEELRISTFIDGMIYVLGVDPKFKYADHYKEILYNYNNNIEDYILYKGHVFIEQNKLDDGMIYFRALVKVNPRNVKGLFNYACTLEQKANEFYKNNHFKVGVKFIRQATAYLEDILEVDSDFSLAYYKLGFHYQALKQFKKCQIVWERFIELDKDENRVQEIKENLTKIQDDVTYEEGYNEILRGNPKEGLSKLLTLRERYSDWWNLLFMTGLAYRQLGRFAEAKREFEKVLAIKPNQVDSLNEIGLCLANLGEFEKAVEKFTKAIELRPMDYEIRCNRGMTYLQLGDIEKAIEDIEFAYEQNPADEITISCKRQIDKLRSMS